jgi:alcohol dehydrogenase class IV
MACSYNQLCPVIFGTGAVEQLPVKVKELGGTKALCIYDNGVKAAGISDKIIAGLAAAGIEVVTFDGVMPDAPDTVINNIGKLAQDEKVDIVIGVGGGSTLDSAKAAAILVENPLPINRYFVTTGIQFQSSTPVILVPTAAGTGSEVTLMAVLHDHELHAKNGVLKAANLAIVDPELTLTVPPAITAATGLDALSHAIEAFTSNRSNPKSDVLSLAAIKLVAENLEIAYKNGSDIASRENLSFASNIAGMAFNDASVHFGHAAAHELGVRLNVSHGVACAYTIPEVIAFSADSIPRKSVQIAEALGLKLPQGTSAEAAANAAADWIRNLMRRLRIKSLREQGISREAAVSCAQGAVENNWFVVCAPKPVDVSVMACLIGRMYDNYM